MEKVKIKAVSFVAEYGSKKVYFSLEGEGHGHLLPRSVSIERLKNGTFTFLKSEPEMVMDIGLMLSAIGKFARENEKVFETEVEVCKNA